MFKNIVFTLLFTMLYTTTFATLDPVFEIDKTATNNDKDLIRYPGGSLHKSCNNKKIIVRRSDGTLRYGIALHFLAIKCETPALFAFVGLDKNSKQILFKHVPYENIFLLPSWLVKKEHPETADDSYDWSPEADAKDLADQLIKK